MASKRSFLRDNILALLRECGTSPDEDFEVLAQCSTHLRTRQLLRKVAQECGLTLTAFPANDALEFYYGIARGHRNLGYIAKEWDDPTFRVGDFVEIGWWDKDGVKTRLPKLTHVCGANGIALTIHETPFVLELQFDGVIGREGFDRATLAQALGRLNACLGTISKCIPVHMGMRVIGDNAPCWISTKNGREWRH